MHTELKHNARLDENLKDLLGPGFLQIPDDTTSNMVSNDWKSGAVK